MPASPSSVSRPTKRHRASERDVRYRPISETELESRNLRVFPIQSSRTALERARVPKVISSHFGTDLFFVMLKLQCRANGRLMFNLRLSATLAAWLVLTLNWPCWAQSSQSVDGEIGINQVRSTLRPEDVDGRLQLASHAIQSGSTALAEDLYREALRIAPSHDAAYERLCSLAGQRRLATDSETLRRAKEFLPARFADFQSKRFVVMTDASPSIAQVQLALLERTHHQFQRFATHLDLRPLPLRNKLVYILFSDERDYRSFAQTQDGVTDSLVTGYYSPRYDWIVFYSAETNPQVIEARKRLEQYRLDVDEMSAQVMQAVRQGEQEAAESLRDALMQSQAHLATQHRHIDEYAKRETMVTTIHEAIHQLLFHTRVQAGHTRYPLWICEGLATCFETEDSSKPFGPEHDYAPRRTRFHALLDSNSLLPLRDFVHIDDTDDQEQADVVYQQSYAMVMWMTRHRKEQLREYLMLMLEQPPGAPDAQTHVRIFEQAFGEIEMLERKWLLHERRLFRDASMRQPARVP